MDRRNFLKLPMSGAVLLSAAAVASKLEIPESKLKVVEAWDIPDPVYKKKIEFITEFPTRIVAMTVHQGQLYCATENAVYLVPIK